MLLIVRQCFLMMLSRKIIVRKATLQPNNVFLYEGLSGRTYMAYYISSIYGMIGVKSNPWIMLVIIHRALHICLQISNVLCRLGT